MKIEEQDKVLEKQKQLQFCAIKQILGNSCALAGFVIQHPKKLPTLVHPVHNSNIGMSIRKGAKEGEFAYKGGNAVESFAPQFD